MISRKNESIVQTALALIRMSTGATPIEIALEETRLNHAVVMVFRARTFSVTDILENELQRHFPDLDIWMSDRVVMLVENKPFDVESHFPQGDDIDFDFDYFDDI